MDGKKVQKRTYFVVKRKQVSKMNPWIKNTGNYFLLKINIFVNNQFNLMSDKEIISRDHDCLDFHPHCKKILELDPKSCDDDFISNQFMRVACMETCGRCEDKVRFKFVSSALLVNFYNAAS